MGDVEQMERFVAWVASHRLERGVYADEEHEYEEWVRPDGAEAELGEIVARAREVLR